MEEKEHDLSGITVDGVPLAACLEEVDTTARTEAHQAAKEEQNKHKKYRRPIVKSTDRKEKNGEARSLTIREMHKEYWQRALSNACASGDTVSAKVLITMLGNPPMPMDDLFSIAKEAYGADPCPKRSWTACVQGTWQKSPIYNLLDISKEEENSKNPGARRRGVYGLKDDLRDFPLETLRGLCKPSAWGNAHMGDFLLDNPQFAKYYTKEQLMLCGAMADNEPTPPTAELPPVEVYDDIVPDNAVEETRQYSLEFVLGMLRTAADRAGLRVKVEFVSK